MKVNELMIGDWVYFGEKAYRKEKEEQILQLLKFDNVTPVIVELKNTPVMVIGVSEYTLDFSGLNQKVINVPLEIVEPIPLTPEILEKNGWKICKVADCSSYWHDAVPFDIPKDGTLCKKEKMFCDDYFESIYISLEYVHELQHALRLCGLNDLADNFKI